MFGVEEIEEIQPAINEAMEEGINIPEKKPTPPDSIFSKAIGGWYDIVVAMYHDQGHIPLKVVGFVYNHEKKAWDAAGERYRAVGKAMGVKGIDEMNDAEAADATIAAVKQLSADVGIPANLQGILKEEDIHFLAESAFADACCPGNPRDTSVEEIEALYKSQL